MWRERLGHGGLEFGERRRRRLAALPADLAHERPALVHRGRADDAALVGARVEVADLAGTDARLRLDRHLPTPCKLRARGLEGRRPELRDRRGADAERERDGDEPEDARRDEHEVVVAEQIAEE